MRTIGFCAGVLAVMAARVPAHADPGDSCTIQVIGGVSATEKIVEPPSKPGVDRDPRKGPHVTGGTAYWMTDTQLNSSNAELKRVTGNKMQLDRDDPLALLTVGCNNEDVTFMLSPAQKSKRANVPFKPGRYRLAEERAAKPGDFTALLYLIEKGEPKAFTLSGSGQLELTQMDARGVAGKFSFPVKESFGTRTATVTGTISVKCKGTACKP